MFATESHAVCLVSNVAIKRAANGARALRRGPCVREGVPGWARRPGKIPMRRRPTVCLKVPFRLAAQTFQLGRRMSSSQKGCGTSVTSSKPVAIGSTSGLESTEAAASIDGGWATRLTRGRVRCGEVWPRITLVGEKLLLGIPALRGDACQ